jgi:hypothetical protein
MTNKTNLTVGTPTEYHPLRTLGPTPLFGPGDTLVIFGEVFERGYVNGLIDEAKKSGLKVIYATVGRRDENQNLRALTDEELKAKGHGPIINIPLEAGFDLETDDQGTRPVDQLKEYGLTGWEDAQLDWTRIEQSRKRGVERFRNATKLFISELRQHIDLKRNLIFAHTMAGGFPRARVVMPIANRVFKGSGARFSSSEQFWTSEIGQLCEKSFHEVTAETFRHLIDLSRELREEVTKNGAKVSYAAFGYHGNEVLVGEKFEWYSYSPYLQGFAKVALEQIAIEAKANHINACVFNVPEILTNSSSIFLGVEVVLYPLMRALKSISPQSQLVQNLTAACQAKLKDAATVDDIDRITQEYLHNPKVRSWPSFKNWPQHNGPDQMELMRNCSSALIDLHKSNNDLMTADLSEIVFRACGKVMFHEIANPARPVVWICHDLVAKVALSAI